MWTGHLGIMEMLLDKAFFKEVTGRVHYIGMERIYPNNTHPSYSHLLHRISAS